MGNEVSRPAETSPPSGFASPVAPSTPTRAQSFSTRSPPAEPPNRRTSSGSLPQTNPRKERSIQRMDKAIRRRVRGGVTYNMKLLLRGARGTGKTSLFQRLQGQPIPETHESTPQLQSATINWSFRANLEESVKCEVWDVVDKGFREQEELESEQNGVVDATTVDVYHEAHGVIFLLDVTRWDTLEYVKQQLDSVPVHIPTLVLGNFRDKGAERKIFKEDIQELLYGSKDRPQQQWRRPVELLYFECSLLNCYGLKSLHQYFGIPFLQLKLATIRQQMRIVEGEFSHLKHDLQANITEQRYADYIEHIRATGSDIRTGRRVSGTSQDGSRQGSGNLDKVALQDDADDESIVVGNDNSSNTSPKTNGPVAAEEISAKSATPEPESLSPALATEDLPARSSFAVAAAPLKIEHKESVTAMTDDVGAGSVDEPTRPEETSVQPSTRAAPTPSRSQKGSTEEVMHLEDFQVPKTRMSDLDHFYSEDESEEEEGEYDEDVVVAPSAGGMNGAVSSGVYHKQRFLDSDSDDSDDDEGMRTRSVKAKKAKSPRRSPTTTKNGVDRAPAQSPQRSSPHPPSPSRPVRSSRPVSPARPQSGSASRETSPRQRLSASPVPTPPAAPPTSPLTSSIRHASSPKAKGDSEPPTQEQVVSGSSVQEDAEAKDTAFASEGAGALSTTETELTTQEESEVSASATTNPTPSNDLTEEAKGEVEEIVLQESEQPDINGTEQAQSDASGGMLGSNSKGWEALPDTTNSTEPENNDVESFEVKMETQDIDTFLTENGGDEDEAPRAEDEAIAPGSLRSSTPRDRPDVAVSDEEVESTDHQAGSSMSLASLQAALPIPAPPSPVSNPEPSISLGTITPGSHRQEVRVNGEKVAAPSGISDLLSLSALQASLPIPSLEGNYDGNHSGDSSNRALHLSDLQETPPPALPDFSTVVPSNDLEAFLNESDSDSENAAPANSSSKRSDGRPVVESSGDEDGDDQDRFASYAISKKSRSERRRQQKEDLRQLNAALEKPPAWEETGPSGLTAPDSLGSVDVVEAIRKAQEEAMRMLPDDDAESSSSKKRHKHKHKKAKKDEDKKERAPKRSHKSSSRSRKHRPVVEDDVA